MINIEERESKQIDLESHHAIKIMSKEDLCEEDAEKILLFSQADLLFFSKTLVLLLFFCPKTPRLLLWDNFKILLWMFQNFSKRDRCKNCLFKNEERSCSVSQLCWISIERDFCRKKIWEESKVHDKRRSESRVRRRRIAKKYLFENQRWGGRTIWSLSWCRLPRFYYNLVL